MSPEDRAALERMLAEQAETAGATGDMRFLGSAALIPTRAPERPFWEVAPSNLGSVTRITPERRRGSHFDSPEWGEFLATVERNRQETLDNFGRNLPWAMGLAPRTAIRAAWGLGRTGQAIHHGVKRVQAGSRGIPRPIYDAAYPARLRDLFRRDPTEMPTPNFTDLTVLARIMEEIRRTQERE